MSKVHLLIVALALAAPSALNAQESEEVAALKERIALLEAQLKAVTLERDALQTELDEVHAANEGRAAARKELLPLQSTWSGKIATRQGGKVLTFSATCQITHREGKKVTFLTTVENGAVWELDGEFTTARQFKIVAARRRVAADAVADRKDLPPAAGLTGKGNTDGKKLNLQYIWREAGGGPIEGRSELTRDE